jgi:hypothetical protein
MTPLLRVFVFLYCFQRGRKRASWILSLGLNVRFEFSFFVLARRHQSNVFRSWREPVPIQFCVHFLAQFFCRKRIDFAKVTIFVFLRRGWSGNGSPRRCRCRRRILRRLPAGRLRSASEPVFEFIHRELHQLLPMPMPMPESAVQGRWFCVVNISTWFHQRRRCAKRVSRRRLRRTAAPGDTVQRPVPKSHVPV